MHKGDAWGLKGGRLTGMNETSMHGHANRKRALWGPCRAVHWGIVGAHLTFAGCGIMGLEDDGVKDDEGCYIMSQCADIMDGPIYKILADFND